MPLRRCGARYAPLAAFQRMMPPPAKLRRLARGGEIRTLVLGCGNSELSEHLRDAVIPTANLPLTCSAQA